MWCTEKDFEKKDVRSRLKECGTVFYLINFALSLAIKLLYTFSRLFQISIVGTVLTLALGITQTFLALRIQKTNLSLIKNDNAGKVWFALLGQICLPSLCFAELLMFNAFKVLLLKKFFFF